MCDPATAILGAGAVSGLSSLVGGGISASASEQAAQTQAAASKYAANLQYQGEQQALAAQQQNFGQITQNLAPYRALGQEGVDALSGPLLGALTNNTVGPTTDLNSVLNAAGPPPSNLALLAQTPGYKFTQQQGLEATQNSFAAQGLGRSGAALKGAANYAENLAATTYQQQYQNWLSTAGLDVNTAQANNQQQQTQSQLLLGQNNQVYNMLLGLTNTGAQAATNQGQFGTQAATNIGNIATQSASAIGSNLTSAAAAQAAGTVGSANAISGAISGVSGAGSNTALLLALNQSGLFSGGAGAGGGLSGLGTD